MGKYETTIEETKRRMIKEEYKIKIWKKNTPFLYDFLITHALHCASCIVEWLPDQVEAPGRDYSVQKFILGTHSYGREPDYLMLAQVNLGSALDF
ncbi:unnamed protein product [Amaranthus hypochondriacus]